MKQLIMRLFPGVCLVGLVIGFAGLYDIHINMPMAWSGIGIVAVGLIMMRWCFVHIQK